MGQIIMAKLRPWGNSLGITIPKYVVIKENLKPEKTIMLELKEKTTLKDFFGKGKHKKVDAEKLRQEAKKMWGMD